MKIISCAFLICSTLLLGACDKEKSENKNAWENAPIVQPEQPKMGRYQIVFSPHVRADTYLLDTEKGKVWQMVKFSDMPDQPTAWDEMEILDSTGEIGMKHSDFKRIYGSGDNPKKKSFSFEEAKSPK